ncbi:ATP-dependent DNA helicase RecG [Candidatus Parcubacteria bacterium]|nr:MAG: ATP-dependent DNA helicase RecG [Candidatus Parcubacteria bacterium]
MSLKTPISQAGLTYKLHKKQLEKLDIKTLEELLYHIPLRYEDYSIISKINIIQPGETVTIQGKIINAKNQYTRKGFNIQKITVEDETGKIDCIWFNQPFVLKSLKENSFVSIAGRVENPKTITVKEYEETNPIEKQTTHTAKIIPIYPETKGLTSKWIRNRIAQLLQTSQQEISEHLPKSIINKHNLTNLQNAIHEIHFPQNLQSAQKAKERLAFDELFLTQLGALQRKKEWEKQKVTYGFNIAKHRDKINKFWKQLPFELTNAQKRAVQEIFLDLNSKIPMNRLLEGDVGSGKTVVAAIAIYIAYLNGFQSALMAPTEILAQQHHNTISSLLNPLGVKVKLITGSKKPKKTKTKDPNSEFTIQDQDDFDILIGTHALISNNVNFKKLGLVVIDEQQRFGVEQRTILRNKGINPHFLTMTATPIPRTIILTIYGDLELSYLDEMPKGRKTVKTWLAPPNKRQSAYEWIRKKVNEKDERGKGNQVFIICPLIEESENIKSVKAAVREYEKLKNFVFKEFNVDLLHGKMKSKEKDEILNKFRDGKTDILVATPVVEVGIDIPNATIMLIETSERFGLSALHQLRGRVGRGQKESYCFLFTESDNPKTLERLRSLEKIYFGPELAELDLKLRGPGDIYGTAQHGKTGLKIASFSNLSLIQKTKTEAEKILQNINSHPKLLKKLESFKTSNISPD